ncbi:MAG: hypothetical protein P1U61_04325 [Legionellaceae bacterium]|nr:hypothetical protein [Legionellaceae bacterium]
MMTDIATQTDFDTSTQVSNHPVQQLQALSYRVEIDATAFKVVLEETYQIFNTLKKESFEVAAEAFHLCASIAGLCALHITKKGPYHALFEHALSMQDYYLAHNKQDRIILEEHLITRDQYASMVPGVYQMDVFQPLSNLLELSANSGVTTPLNTRGTQVNMPVLPKVDEVALMPLKPTVQAMSTMSAVPSWSADSFRERLERIEMQTHSNGKSKAFKQLKNDLYQYIQDIKKEHPITTTSRYAMDTPIIQDLELALEIQAAYIHYLKVHQKSKHFILSGALKEAASLWRTLNAYYQHTDASEALKEVVRNNAHFMQFQSMNVKSIVACGHVVTSEKTSADEKKNAKEQQKARVAVKQSGIQDICSAYQGIVEEAAADFVVDNSAVIPDTYQILSLEFSRLKASMEGASFYPLFQQVSGYVNGLTKMLLPQAPYILDYLSYIDDNHSSDVFDLSTSAFMRAQSTIPNAQLLQAFALFYAIKIAHLDEILSKVDGNSDDAQLALYARFMSATRLSTYEYLLAPLMTNDLYQVKQDCESILREQERATPLINALASERLFFVEQEIQAQCLQTYASPEMSTEPQASPPKKLSSSAIKRAKKRAKKLAAEKQAAASSNELSISARWEEVESAYEQTTLSAPGWMALRAEVIELLQKSAHQEALDVLNDWIDEALSIDTMGSLLKEKGLFDGYLHKAIILRNLNKLDEAIQCLGEAWKRLATEEHAKTRYYQIQKVMLEKGLAYHAQGQTELASIAFIEANKMAEANNTFCFYLLNQDLAMMSADDYKEAIKSRPELITWLNMPPNRLFVDEYSQPYFHDFYGKLAKFSFLAGAELLNQSNAYKALGRRAAQLEQNGMVYMNQCLDIHRALLGYCQIHNPGRVLPLQLMLASTYRNLRMLTRKKTYQVEANKALDAAMQLAVRADDKAAQQVITGERLKLGEALKVNVAATERAIQQEAYQGSLKVCDIQQNAYQKEVLQNAMRVTNPEPLMLLSIQKYAALTELKNIYRVLDRLIPSNQPRGRKEALKNNIANVALKELGNVGMYLGVVTMQCVIACTQMSDEKEASARVLIRLYDTELHYLVQLKRILNGQESEERYRFNPVTEGVREKLVEQTDKVKALEVKIRAYLQLDKTTEQLKMPLSELTSAKAEAACSLQHLIEVQPIAISELENFARNQDMPAAFTTAIEQIKTGHIWVALYELLTCANEQAEHLQTIKQIYTGAKGKDKNKDEMLSRYTRQKATVHAVTAKIMHWTLEKICSDLVGRIEGAEESAHLKVVFDGLKQQCAGQFRKASEGVSFIEVEGIKAHIKAVKALTLPEAPEATARASNGLSL